jgi:hypothetical protein
MSGELKGIPQPPIDPEKGTLDPLPLQLPWDGDLKTKEKDAAVTTTTTEVVVAKPKPPAKRKASKWILWNLWFNTYRYIPPS